MSESGGGRGSGDGYAAIDHIHQIWEMHQTGEQSRRIAQTLGVSLFSVRRIRTMCRELGRPPSQRRLCLCVLRHTPMQDDDIAEMFGRTSQWVSACRRDSQAIREAEPIQDHLEWFDEGMIEADPTLAQIAERAAEVRAYWLDGLQGVYAEGCDAPFLRRVKEAHA